MSFVLTYDSLVSTVINDLERNDPIVTDSMDSWIKFAHERIARDSNTQLFEVYVGGTFQPGTNVLQKPNRWQNTITFNYGSGPAVTTLLANNPITTTINTNTVVVTFPDTTPLMNDAIVTISNAPPVGGLSVNQLNIQTSITIINGTSFSYVVPGLPATATTTSGGNGISASYTQNFNNYNILKLRTYEWCRDYWPDATLESFPLFYADYGYQNWFISPTPDQAYPFELAYLETPQVIDSTFQVNYLTEFMPEVLIRAVLLEAMLTLKNDERTPLIEDSYVKLITSWNNKDKLRKFDRYTTREAD